MEMNVKRNDRRRVKRWNSDTSNASIPHIPEEIQIEILSWLPPQSLSRCKRVSKHWNDKLTMQAFLLNHSRSYDKHSNLAFFARSSIWRRGSVISIKINDDNTRKTTGSMMIQEQDVIRAPEVYFSDFLMNDYICMSNICNDLICLFDPNTTRAGLVNIKTGDFICLPAITIKHVDPFKLSYALGFDPIQKVFKVLCIIYGITSKECPKKAAILIVGSKYWNPIENKSLPSLVTEELPLSSSTNTICFDGVIYWVRKSTLNSVILLTVVAFDLNHEVSRQYELIRTPVGDMSFNYYLTSLKDCPTLIICKKKRYDNAELEQWTLFNHKSPNAAWKMRNFTNFNFPIMNYDGIAVAGGSVVLLRQLGWTKSRGRPVIYLYECWDYSRF